MVMVSYFRGLSLSELIAVMILLIVLASLLIWAIKIFFPSLIRLLVMRKIRI